MVWAYTRGEKGNGSSCLNSRSHKESAWWRAPQTTGGASRAVKGMKMNESISNRHRGNLGGKFTDSRLPAKVTVIIADEVASNRPAQHLLWMLVNLLARQPDEIQEIELIVPKGVKPIERLSPLISVTTDLDLALQEGMNQLHPGVVI